MPTFTPNYSFNLPGVADPVDADLWGGQLNGNFTSIDTQLRLAQRDIGVAKNVNFTVLTTELNYFYACNPIAGNITVSLPSIATAGTGARYTFMKVDGSTNTVIIDGFGAELINGSATLTLSTQHQWATLYCDGTFWWAVR